MPFDGVGFVYDASLEKLDAVMDLLGSPDRWCKGALRSHDGRYCIRGAIRAVNGAELLEPVILQAIGQVAGRRVRRIEAFNDHPNTSHDQVVAVLSRARRNIEGVPSAATARPALPADHVATGMVARCRAGLGQRMGQRAGKIVADLRTI